jgi:hypothetical protein
MSSKNPDLDELYGILRAWAIAGRPQSYGDLSRAYHGRTNDWFEPHGTWDRPLGELNNRLAAVGAPALSALVILHDKNEPGGGFWGCAANVPHRPHDEIARISEWNRIVTAVLAYEWPSRLP